MKSIGGYFELELNNGGEYHAGGIRLSSGRNAFEYILRARDVKEIHIPYYICNSVIEPLHKLDIEISYYFIYENLSPKIDDLRSNDSILFINYFGLAKKNLLHLSSRYQNIIVDNSQAFFISPMPNQDTFYSCRKYFGVPDGAYVFSKNNIADAFDYNLVKDNFSHLLERIEVGAEKGYQSFIKNEDSFNKQPMRKMSKISERLLKTIDYKNIVKIRNSNFQFLDARLKKYNQLVLDNNSLNGPMVYPLLLKNELLRSKLITSRIFVPLYWQSVLDQRPESSWEYYLAKYLIPLPIDQRYSIDEMQYICTIVEECING